MPADSPTAAAGASAAADHPPGWSDYWQHAWDGRPQEARAEERQAVRVERIDKGGITVATDPDSEELVVAAKAVRWAVVGDFCAIESESRRIEEILPRRTVFERRSPGADRGDVSVESKALAANMDVVLILQALDAGVNTARLTRELILAWQSGARPVVVLTKSDLVAAQEVDTQRQLAASYSPGATVVCVATRHDVEISELSPQLSDGTVAALLGASGTGKSTLANALAGHTVQLTAEVREGDQRGRHTTTAGQMIPLSRDRWLIDTPGIRGVGLWDCDDGLEKAFADFLPFAEQCRFVDCSHSSEPGCGLLEAVETGEISAGRLELWHQLIDEVEQLESEMELRDRDLKQQKNQKARYRAAAQRGKPRQ